MQLREDGCTPADANYPVNCNWPSLLEVPAPPTIMTQGDQVTSPTAASTARRSLSGLGRGRQLQDRRRALHRPARPGR